MKAVDIASIIVTGGWGDPLLDNDNSVNSTDTTEGDCPVTQRTLHTHTLTRTYTYQRTNAAIYKYNTNTVRHEKKKPNGN